VTQLHEKLDSTDGRDTERAATVGVARAQRAVRLRRSRRLLVVALLASPTLVSVALDATRRGSRILSFEPYYVATYGAAFLESLVLWSVLLYAASRRRGRARGVAATLFVVGVTFAFGGQAYFHEQYGAYLNVDVSLFASNFMDSVVNQLFADWANYARAKLPAFAFAVALVWAARRVVRPLRRPARIAVACAPVVLAASFFIPTQHRHVQAATPDTLYMHAVGGLLRTQLGLSEQSGQVRPRARSSLPVAPLASRRSERPNVLFVLLESVRADSACTAFEPGCQRTGFTNELLPDRLPLLQMRALDSSTAISLAVLWSGVGPHESREVLHTWPLIFDYARSAGYDTAFWTSQNMMFGNSRLWVKNLGVRRFASATDLDATSDLDMGAPEHLLAERVNGQLDDLQEPFLAVVQLSNVHYPYYVNEAGPQPFQPAEMSKAPEDNLAFKNYYQNSVYQQDQHVAAMIRKLRASKAGSRTVIVYTSDHGEAFREHGQMGHTFSIFDEEIRVPAWIDAPPGTLTEDEVRNLRDKRDAYTFHVDVVPTILDIMGVLDDPNVAPYRSKMLGTSLLRRELTTQPLPMTNCAGVWSCAFENWGFMRGPLKLEARAWDTGYKCYDVSVDPLEQYDLGAEACGELLPLARRTFRRVPGEDVSKPEHLSSDGDEHAN
jgi:glucan phosphoethanolaminetransferase (alkaline phosphatase superfamily)